MKTTSFRKFVVEFDSALPLVLAAIVVLCWFITGCNDGGTEYELVPGHTGSGGNDAGSGVAGGSGTLNPPSSTGNGGNIGSCQHVPYKWELISWNGCMTSPRMTGLIRDKLDGTITEAFFHGKDFATTTGGPVAGQTFVLTKPEPNECGPALLTMVSNSGTVNVKVFRNSAGEAEEVEFYLLHPDLMDNVWQGLYDSPRGPDTYYTQAFSGLMLSVFDCHKNADCKLRKDLIAKGKSLPPGIVFTQPVTSEASANGSFCGTMLLVAKSRP